MNETNWIPGLVVLGGALVAGLALAVRSRSGPRIPGLAPGRGGDLERQRDALYQQIRELDGSRAVMEAADWRRERLRLELEAARTLQAMDRPTAPTAPTTPRRETWSDRHPRLANAAWGAGAGLFVAAVVLSVQSASKPKEGGMGGGAMGGGAAQDQQQVDPRLLAALDEAKKAADAKPDDVPTQLLYAKLLLDSGQLMDAFQVAKKVTEKDPENPTARTYQAAVLIEVGDLATAGRALDKVLSGYPDHLEALAYRGLVFYMSGDREAAAQKWERVVTLDPSKAPEFEPLVQMARNPQAAPPSMGAAGGPAAGGAGGPAAGPMAGGSHVDDPADVAGTITVSAAVGAVPPGQTVFVYARPAGQDRGPPAAARRFKSEELPITFRIGPSDSPMGGPFPTEMTISARIDADGNAMTHGPDDLEAKVSGVKPGATGLTLELAHPAQ